MLALLELDLGGRAGLDDGDAASELGEALLQLLAVVVGVSVLDLLADLAHAGVQHVLVASALDDGGLILGDDDLAGAAQQLKVSVLEGEADGLGDDLAARQDGHVLQHRLAALAEAGGLDGHGLEGAADLVDDQRGEGFALDVLGDDRQGLAGLHDLLQDGDDVLDVGDLGVHEENVSVLEDGFLAFLVGHEVGRQVALVEAHTLGGLQGGVEGVGLLDGNDAFGADLVEGLGDELADGGVVGGDRGRGGDLLGGLDGLGVSVQLGDDGLDGLVDAALEGDRVGAGGDVTQALVDQRLGQNGRGGGAVTCDVVGLLGNFLHQLGADALERIVQVDFLGDGNAILGDRGGAPLLVEHDVAALGAQRHLNGVGQQVEAVLHAATGILIKLDDLGHWEYILPRCGSGPMPATDDRAWRRPHRTCGLVTLHVGVLGTILALTLPECKARSAP